MVACEDARHDGAHDGNLGGFGVVGGLCAELCALCARLYTLAQLPARGGGRVISDTDRDNLRARMPEVLAIRCGIGDVRRSFRCPSPAHDDRDPSAHYYANDNSVHCFGCNRTWDVFSLVGELDGIEGFPEQARAVADMVGYRLEDDGGKPGRARRRIARPRPRPPSRPSTASTSRSSSSTSPISPVRRTSTSVLRSSSVGAR